MKFIIQFFKLMTYSIVVVVLLILALNYASPFYRYPLFKWFSSLIEDQYVIKQIGSIELKPVGFSNQIKLSNLEIYHREIGEDQSLKINHIAGNLDFATFWDKGILFERITLDSVSINAEALIGLLMSGKSIEQTDFYKNLQIYLPEDSKLGQTDRQNQNDINRLKLDDRLIKQLTNQIKLTDSKIILGGQEINIISATLDLTDKNPTIQAKSLNLLQAEFRFDLVLDNDEDKLFFEIFDLPVSEVSQLFNQPKFSFLNSGFKSNLKGYFDFKNMILQLNNFNISHPIINLNGSLKYQQRNNRNLEIAAKITQAIEINQLMQIWPKAFFDNSLNSWLNSAFKAGQISKTDFFFQSSLNNLSTIDQTELFSLDIQMRNLLFNFDSDWQDLSINQANLKINNLGMEIRAKINDQDKNEINITSKIDSFHQNPLLKINLNSIASGDFINQWIANNPLNENPKLRSLLDLNLKGKTNSQIDLSIPLNENDNPDGFVDFSGKLQLIENNIRLNDWLVIEKIAGEVIFDANNVKSVFTGNWWNNPIEVQFKNLNENELGINFKLDFQAISSLDYFFQALEFDNPEIINQIKKSIDGKSQFVGKVVASNNPDYSDDLSALNNFNFSIALNSSLDGLALNLIEPLIKTKDELSPFSIELAYANEKISFKNLKFNDQINASLVKGVNQSLIDISIIDLNLDSEKIKFLLAVAPTKTFEQKLNQKALFELGLPDMDLTIYRLRYDNRDVGSVSSKFRNFPDRIEFQDINLSSSLIEMKAQITSNSSETSIIANNTKDNPLSDYFNYLQYKPITKDAISQINLNLSWPGQLWDYENAALNGNINILTNQGILMTNLESSFFPRLIKELSLSSIRDRLKNILSFKKIIESLNPTTVFKEGIEFNKLDIRLGFKDNQIISEKMNFNSPSINIAIQGVMDWQNKTLNHTAVVNPDLFKVLPAVGLFTGNIPVAIAGVIGNRLFDTKEFFKVSYSIKGNLDKPQIQLLTAD